MTQIPAGWYPDPAPVQPGQVSGLRYWDGTGWTAHVHAPQPMTQPVTQPMTQPMTRPTYPEPYPQGGAPAAPQDGGPSAAPSSVPVATTPDGQPLAGWGRRALARLLDTMFVVPLCAVATIPVVASQWAALEQWVDDLTYAAETETADPPTPDLFDVTTGPGITLALSILAAYLLYEAVFLLWKQATPGKMVLGLRVRRREAPGLPGSAVAGRVGFALLNQCCGLLLLLDSLWPLWDDKKQALHDKVARTNVVLADAPPVTAPPTVRAPSGPVAGVTDDGVPIPRRW